MLVVCANLTTLPENPILRALSSHIAFAIAHDTFSSSTLLIHPVIHMSHR
jgi:hypothetical protein